MIKHTILDEEPDLSEELKNRYFDRFLVASLMGESDHCPWPEHVPVYVMNPQLEGADSFTLRGRESVVEVKPALVAMPEATDRALRKLLGVEADLCPFWLGRFAALTCDSFVIGYASSTPRGSKPYKAHVRTVSFDYRAARPLFDERFEAVCADPIAIESRIGRIAFHSGLEIFLGVLAQESQVPIDLRHYIGEFADLGAMSARHLSPGGDA